MAQTTSFMWPLVATWTTDFSTDLGCRRTTDPDIVLGVSLGLDVIMAPGGGKDHPGRQGPSRRVASVLQHGLRWRSRPLESAWPSVATGATDIDTGPGCFRTRDPDIALGSSPAQPSPWLCVASKPPPSVYTSLSSFLPFCLFPQYMNHSFCFSFPPIFPPHICSS